MSNIKSRIDALAAEFQRRAMLQVEPVDALSASLFEMGRELATLDNMDKAELLEELNSSGGDGTVGLDLTLEELEKMIADYGRKDKK